MAKINKKLFFKDKNGTIESCWLYDTQPSGEYIKVVFPNSQIGYSALVSPTNAQASIGRIVKDDITYAVAKE